MYDRIIYFMDNRFYFIAYYYVFREEGKKERVSIVTFKDNLPIRIFL